MKLVASLLTFPPTGWWVYAARAEEILFEKQEHFQKMSDRNRYCISGSNNSILLTIPLVNGRNQAAPIQQVQILNDGKWQVQHWRTLVSVYNRSPYFYHYEATLKQLFDTEYDKLTDFNMAALNWVRQQMKLNYQAAATDSYVKYYGHEYTDLRGWKNDLVPEELYYQVFEDRIGFVPGLSILDLLFSEGPRSADWLRKQGIKG